MQLPFHSYRVENASNARLVNCYAEKAPEGAKGPIILHRAPGISAYLTLGNGPGRGLHVMSDELYAVSGVTAYRITQRGAKTALGTIPGAERVASADNGHQLLLTANHRGFIVTSGAVAEVTDSDLTSRHPGAVAFLDNFALLVDEGTGQFFGSELFDFSDYDGLDFATAEGAPDGLLTLAVDHRQAVLVGTTSTELWDNTGAAGFPFERSPNGLIELGGSGKHAICKQDQSVFILAADRTLRRLNDMTWVRVSQHGFEQEVRQYAVVSDCELTPYTLNGHLCVVVKFPTEGKTWVYDCTSQELYERESYHRLPWDVVDVAECYGKVFVQRQSTGEIGILDASIYTEWGEPIRSEWTYQNVYAAGRRVFHSRLQLGLQTGVGLATGQGSDPRISLEISNNGGKTFFTAPTKTIGAQGKYRTQVHWDRLGSAQDRVYRMSIADPVPLTISNTELEAA